MSYAYDAAGRRVATPFREPLAAGPAEITWDGRDARGHGVPSGLLFVRVDTAGASGAAPAIVLH